MGFGVFAVFFVQTKYGPGNDESPEINRRRKTIGFKDASQKQATRTALLDLCVIGLSKTMDECGRTRKRTRDC